MTIGRLAVTNKRVDRLVASALLAEKIGSAQTVGYGQLRHRRSPTGARPPAGGTSAWARPRRICQRNQPPHQGSSVARETPNPDSVGICGGPSTTCTSRDGVTFIDPPGTRGRNFHRYCCGRRRGTSGELVASKNTQCQVAQAPGCAVAVQSETLDKKPVVTSAYGSSSAGFFFLGQFVDPVQLEVAELADEAQRWLKGEADGPDEEAP